jgi:hypothetical protein
MTRRHLAIIRIPLISVVPLILIWIAAARHTGREFARREKAKAAVHA